MSGTVGIIANDSARYTLFAASLVNLRTPVNTAISWAVGSDRIVGRNNIVRQALDQGSEWVLFLDDDHAFGPDLLLRLLAHDQPIVASLYMGRARPFAPIAYGEKQDDGTYLPIQLPGLPESGLLAVVAAGTGGMLIRSEIFRAVGEPWCEHGRASEDLIFCDKAREAGFPIYLDLATHLGHLAPCSIWPTFLEGEWAVGFTVTDGTSLYVRIEPAETPELASV